MSTYRSRSSLGPLLSCELGPRALHCTAERYDLSEVEVPLVALEESNKIVSINDNFNKQRLKIDFIAKVRLDYQSRPSRHQTVRQIYLTTTTFGTVISETK